MTLLLWTGTTLGAILGLLHGVHLYREMVARSGADATGVNARGLYYAAWTFVLWTVFGSYVLAFWLIGGIAEPLARLGRRRSAP